MKVLSSVHEMLGREDEGPANQPTVDRNTARLQEDTWTPEPYPSPSSRNDCPQGFWAQNPRSGGTRSNGTKLSEEQVLAKRVCSVAAVSKQEC